MKFGWPISLMAHGVIAVGAFVGFANVSKYEPEDNAVTVYLASIDEFTNVRASVKREAPTPTPPETPMTLETPMDNAPEEGNPSQRSVEADPKPIITKNENEDDKLSVTTENKTASLDLDRISDLVNKTRDSQPTANQQRTLTSEQNFLVFSSQAQAMAGEGKALTISEQDAIRQRMREEWTQTTANLSPDEKTVVVAVKLRRDGSVLDVRFAEPGKIARGSELYKVAARNAINAVRNGAPYDFLSAERYGLWQDMEWTFNPEAM